MTFPLRNTSSEFLISQLCYLHLTIQKKVRIVRQKLAFSSLSNISLSSLLSLMQVSHLTVKLWCFDSSGDGPMSFACPFVQKWWCRTTRTLSWPTSHWKHTDLTANSPEELAVLDFLCLSVSHLSDRLC